MKAKLFLAMLSFVIEFTSQLPAQIISDSVNNRNSDYFNVSISAGVSGILKGVTSNQFGFSYNIDVSNAPKNRIGIFLNYSNASFPKENSLSNYRRHTHYSQLTLGPRFYSGKKNSFIDAGFGYYNLYGREFAGVNMGIGGKIGLPGSYAIVFGGRVNVVNFSKYPDLFYSLNTGIEMNTKNEGESTNYNNSVNNKFSMTAYAGSYSEKNFDLTNNSFGGEISYDVSKRLSLLVNYLYVNSEDIIVSNENNYYSRRSISRNNYSAGARLYLVGRSIRLFAEALTGIFLKDENSESSSFMSHSNYGRKDTFFGYTFGGGAEFLMVDNLSGIFKFGLTDYVTGNSNTGVFGGLKYRL